MFENRIASPTGVSASSAARPQPDAVLSGGSATAFLRRAPDVGRGVGRRYRLGWLILAVLVAIAGSYGSWRGAPFVVRLLSGPPAAADLVEVSGNIEAHQSVLSFTQIEAPIVYLPFDEGAVVTRGTVLARVDDRLYRQ